MSKLFERTIEEILLSFDGNIRESLILKKELESNFWDHKNQLIAEGMSPEKAEKEVVEKFGDPKFIGKMFREARPMGESIRDAKNLANIIGLLSILIGFYYRLASKTIPIQTWGVLAIIAGVSAIVASRLIVNSKLWKSLAIPGFFLVALAQILAVIAGSELINRRLETCSIMPSLRDSNFCTRISEGFLGIGMNVLLFSLCVCFIYKILFPRKTLTAQL